MAQVASVDILVNAACLVLSHPAIVVLLKKQAPGQAKVD
jgi:hypothetical protein